MRFPHLDRARQAAYSLVEIMIALAVASIIFGAVMAAWTSLEQTYTAAQSFATLQRDQQRISDYIALDVRRSLSVNWAGGTGTLTITIPDYYGNGGAQPSPGATPLDPALASGAITYGTTPVTITYYQNGSSFYRTVNGMASAIASNVVDFTVLTWPSPLTCQTTFSPQFTLHPSAAVAGNTFVFTSVYRRNN